MDKNGKVSKNWPAFNSPLSGTEVTERKPN